MLRGTEWHVAWPRTAGMGDLLLNILSKYSEAFSSMIEGKNEEMPTSELDTSSTNEAVNTTHEVSTTNSQGQASSSSYADDVMFSFFASQSNSQQLDNEDMEQIDTDDLEEMDLK
ncbi:hypothetical protein Tco_1482709 [Tanacetum coccineum]